ncbi:hypothetical protein SRO_4586 [Streptomyces rochei]|nr:hypothetical protein SRO_4586 [Streptomyces rochei]
MPVRGPGAAPSAAFAALAAPAVPAAFAAPTAPAAPAAAAPAAPAARAEGRREPVVWPVGPLAFEPVVDVPAVAGPPGSPLRGALTRRSTWVVSGAGVSWPGLPG